MSSIGGLEVEPVLLRRALFFTRRRRSVVSSSRSLRPMFPVGLAILAFFRQLILFLAGRISSHHHARPLSRLIILTPFVFRLTSETAALSLDNHTAIGHE